MTIRRKCRYDINGATLINGREIRVLVGSTWYRTEDIARFRLQEAKRRFPELFSARSANQER